jgi:DNA-binding beta-propeller fold protein YncE
VVWRWTAANNTVTTLVSAGLNGPRGVAVDGAGNVYIAEYYNHAIKELPRAFVDTAAKTEWAGIGSDVLPSVLSASQNLLAPFAPTSSQPWLTISGVANGVVSVDFTANNTGIARAAQITVLGKSITLNQTAATAPVMGGSVGLPDGSFQLHFPTGLFPALLETTAGNGGSKINAKEVIVFPDGLRMYLQRDIKTGAERFQK